MVLIRPVRSADLGQLLQLAGIAGVGLTTLPKDESLLGQRIAKSQAAFAKLPDRPGGESYLLVMEDLDTKKVVGACGMVSKVGGFEPFYAYNIESKLFESKVINVSKVVPILRLVEEHDGPCEVGSLFLDPEYRKHGNGRLLQLVRFLFMAEHPQCFESTVVSEIRGVVDEGGLSPFWDALGKHFFDIDFAEADRLSVVNKRFIADLMPRHPIYIPLLPKSAQDVIGKPHPQSQRAVTNLQAEGFKFNNQVDIFDAGPVMSCPRDEIRTVKQSRKAKIAAIVEKDFSSPQYIIGTTTEHFRAARGSLEVQNPESVRISPACAWALQASVGDEIRYVELESAA
jgi:arginine N-succinyltransferase